MNRLRHEELFQVYKLMLDYAVDDDQLMRIVNSTLEHSCLKMPGEIAIKEFIRVQASILLLSNKLKRQHRQRVLLVTHVRITVIKDKNTEKSSRLSTSESY